MKNRIREIRKERGLTMKELGMAIGLAESTISQYETGKRQPDNETLLKLGKYFSVSIDYLLGAETKNAPTQMDGRELPHAEQAGNGIYLLVDGKRRLGKSTMLASITKIPVLGDVAAGIPIEAITNIVDYEEIDAAMASTGDFFGLRIKGASMEPRMREGDVVIVRKQESAETGDTVVVLVNGDCATVKKIKYGLDGISLIPTNPSYDVQFYSAADVERLPVRVIGRVVELRAKF